MASSLGIMKRFTIGQPYVASNKARIYIEPSSKYIVFWNPYPTGSPLQSLEGDVKDAWTVELGEVGQDELGLPEVRDNIIVRTYLICRGGFKAALINSSVICSYDLKS